MSDPQADYEKGQAAKRAKDYPGAVRSFREAAEKGFAPAQFSLGVMYLTKLGVEQDFREAARWFYEAAKQDHGDAQFFLGQMYVKGDGVDKDYVQAYKWFSLAPKFGFSDMEARKHLQSVEGKMTPQQIAEAQRQVQGFRPVR